MKQKIEEYMTQFLEVPHEAFSGLPPCPFARKERIENRIIYLEGTLKATNVDNPLMAQIHSLAAEENPRTILYFEPQMESSVQDVYKFAQMIVDSCVELSILAIPIHPHDEYTMNEVRTRSLAPTAFVLIQVKEQVSKAKEKLLRTAYYAKNGDQDERFVQSFSSSLQSYHPDVELVTVWWKDATLREVQRGEPFPEPVVGLTIDVLNRNGIYRWLKRFGYMHGWRFLCRYKEDSLELIEACKNGSLVICSGFGGVEVGFLSRVLWNEQQQLHHTPQEPINFDKLIAQGCWIWEGSSS